MRRTLLLLSVMTSLASMTLPAWSQTSKGSDETIVVHGVEQKAVRGEVDKMIAAPWYAQLARWGDSVCPTVAGLPEPYRSVVLDHLQRAARAVIPDLSASCPHPNVMVLFTDDGTAAFNEILAKVPMFGNTGAAVPLVTTEIEPPSSSEIAELRRNRPVRWYRNTVIEPAPGVVTVWSPRFNRYVADDRMKISSFEKSTQARVNSVTVIVDVPLASGATIGQLADYIAFVVLGGPKLGDTFNPVSIMSLYDSDRFNRAAPATLSRFDMAMLHALFVADPARDAHDEQAEISLIVHENLSKQATATAAR